MRPLLRVTASHIRPLLSTRRRSLLCLTTINLRLIQVETLALMASYLGVCALSTLGKQMNPTAWKTTPIRCRRKTRALPSKESFFSWLLYWASSRCYQYLSCLNNIDQAFFSKCQAVISLTSKRRWQLSRSVSLWWTSTMAGHWLGRSSTCPPVTNHWARGGKRAECSFIGAR